MQISGKKEPDFSLSGEWVNATGKRKAGGQVLVELTFYSDTKVIVKLYPCNEFHQNYYISYKPDFNVLNFIKGRDKDNMLPILLFKIINRDTIKVQVTHSDDVLEWDQKESLLNTGILKRKTI